MADISKKTKDEIKQKRQSLAGKFGLPEDINNKIDELVSETSEDNTDVMDYLDLLISSFKTKGDLISEKQIEKIKLGLSK